MKAVCVACLSGLLLGACAQQPVPLSFYEGQFVGPVVARRGTPGSPNYLAWCGEPSRPWRHGHYREFVPCARDEGWARQPGF